MTLSETEREREKEKEPPRGRPFSSRPEPGKRGRVRGSNLEPFHDGPRGNCNGREREREREKGGKQQVDFFSMQKHRHLDSWPTPFNKDSLARCRFSPLALPPLFPSSHPPLYVALLTTLEQNTQQ